MKRLLIVTLLGTFALVFATTMPGGSPLLAQGDRRGDTDTRPRQHELRRSPFTIAPDSLVAGPGGSATRVLTLNFFPDEEPLTAHLVELRRRAPGNFTWYGIIEDDGRSLVLLTAVDGFVDGTVLHNDRMFRIKPSRSGAHYVIEVARNSFGPINDVGPRDRFPPPPPDPGRGHWHPGLGKPWFVDMFRIDVLVAFTPQVLFAYGGGIHAVIQNNISMANITLHASGVATQLRLVHSYDELYSENSLNGQYAAKVLNDLATQNDGFLEQVHVKRDIYAADIVVLLTKWGADCGDAGIGDARKAGKGIQNMGPGNGSGENDAFAVVDVDCAVENFVFSHEVGHLLGAGHDAGASEAPSSLIPPYARGHIHVFDDQSIKVRDIMSYPTACPECTVTFLYSNPDILYPTSVVNQTTHPFGSPDHADNRRRMNELAPWVSGFR